MLTGQREDTARVSGPGRARMVMWALLPLLLLSGVLFLLGTSGGLLAPLFRVPPDAVQRLSIERITFGPNTIVASVRNTGPAAVSIGTVMVNDAIWPFTQRPSGPIPRFGRVELVIPYAWVEAEPHEVKLVTSVGMTFKRTVDVTTLTPEPSWFYVGLFALLGTYVGVIPVFLGLLWYPFLRRLGTKWLNGLLSFTVGLLVFLGLDALKEGLEVVLRVPEAFRAVSLLVLGAGGSFLLLLAIGESRGRRSGASPLFLAYLIALGIGLHNLGEGLAIGAAYQLGEVALGTFLVLGFTMHNTTEGLAIVAPVTRQPPPLRHFLLLGLTAGAPTILGTWIGGFSYADLPAILFLGIGAGAVLQVVYEVLQYQAKGRPVLPVLTEPINLSGLLGGFVFMYLTGLLVTP